MKTPLSKLVLGGILLALSAYILSSFLINYILLWNGESIVSGIRIPYFPGNVLLYTFHVAGIYIPIFLFIMGIFLIQNTWNLFNFFIFAAWIIPSLFLGITLRLLFGMQLEESVITHWFITVFTLRGSIILCLLLTISSIVFLLQAPWVLQMNENNVSVYKPARSHDFIIKNKQVSYSTDNTMTDVDTTISDTDTHETLVKPDTTDNTNTLYQKVKSYFTIESVKTAQTELPDVIMLHDNKMLTTHPINTIFNEKLVTIQEKKQSDTMFFFATAQSEAPHIQNQLKLHEKPLDFFTVLFPPVKDMHAYRNEEKNDSDIINTDTDIDIDNAYIQKSDEACEETTHMHAHESVDMRADDAVYKDEDILTDSVHDDANATIVYEKKSDIIFIDLKQQENEHIADIVEHNIVTRSEAPTITHTMPLLSPHDEIQTIDHEIALPIAAEHAVSEDIVEQNREELEDSISSISTDQYYIPIDGILNSYDDDTLYNDDSEIQDLAQLLRNTLLEFKVDAELVNIQRGPVITMFELLPASGVRITKITGLADNIALRLAATSVRIVAPVPGKHAVGIEVPNRRRSIVGFRELMLSSEFKDGNMHIPFALGKDITGNAHIIDVNKTPHLLIAGATGSGKSVCINALICSILYSCSPEHVNLLLIDPKIVELKFYNDIPHLLTPVITESSRALQALQWCVFEMERRYLLLDQLDARDIESYNRKITMQEYARNPMTYIIVVIDEYADLMATTGKELEGIIARLAAMSRAVGMHLVLATQRPSADVITGIIKANVPSRISFMVTSKIDSRIIMDTHGAEKLLGKGDMLFVSPLDAGAKRLQGAFLSEEEVERVVAYVKTLGEPHYIDDEIFFETADAEQADLFFDDPLLTQAIEIVVTMQKASASYLQRRLKIGYNRAARLIEQLESMGIVGPQNGSKPRDILKTQI